VANGVKMGRKPKLTPHQKREAIRRRDKGEDSLADIGRSYNVPGWTITRLGAWSEWSGVGLVNPASVRGRRSVLPREVSAVSGQPDWAGRKARDRGGEVSRRHSRLQRIQAKKA
jgi:hypothetical protein